MCYLPGDWERTVPWNHIVTVPGFDVPTFKDTRFRVDRLEDDRDVDVLDLVVVLHWSCSDLNASNKEVADSS